MKKFLLIAVASLSYIAAFAQGKIGFANDSLHLVYYEAYPPAPPLSGAVSATNMPGGVTLVADLYVGTVSSSLSYVSTATFGSAQGRWNQVSVLAPFLGGTSVFVMTGIRDSTYSPPATLDPPFVYNFGFWAASEEFTFTLGSSFLYPPMYGTNGNWAPGTYNMDSLGPGFLGAINVAIIPEPCSFALIVFGGAALFVFRRNDLNSPRLSTLPAAEH